MECPGFERLIDYCDGSLAEEEARVVATHLATGCRRCADDLRWYERVRSIAAADNYSIEPPPWVLKRALRLFEREPGRSNAVDGLGRLVAALIFDSLSRPALSGLRLVGTNDRQLLYRAGQYSIDLQIALANQSDVDLTGQVLRANESRFESVAMLELELRREGEAVYSTLTNDAGGFTMKAIARGEYELLIETREGTIIVQRLPLITS
jgi:hypothetical protein